MLRIILGLVHERADPNELSFENLRKTRFRPAPQARKLLATANLPGSQCSTGMGYRSSQNTLENFPNASPRILIHPPGEMLRNLIFDWSGTLADDLGPVIEATNLIFRHYGKPELLLEEFRERFCLPFDSFYEEHLPGVATARDRAALSCAFRRATTHRRAPPARAGISPLLPRDRAPAFPAQREQGRPRRRANGAAGSHRFLREDLRRGDG